MSYELCFWHRDCPGDPLEVYRQVSDGLRPDGIPVIRSAELVGRVQQALLGRRDETIASAGMCDIETDDGALQLTWGPFYVRTDCYGLSAEKMNTVVDIAFDLDCPLYDPQVNKRFVTTPD